MKKTNNRCRFLAAYQTGVFAIKKCIAFTLSLLLVLALAACGGEKPPNGQDAPATGENDEVAIPFASRTVSSGMWNEGDEPLPYIKQFNSTKSLAAFFNETTTWTGYGQSETITFDYCDESAGSRLEYGVSEALAAHDNAWFKSHTLLIAVLETGTGSARVTATSVQLASSGLVLTVDSALPGEGMLGTCDMRYWMVLVELDGVYKDMPATLEVSESFYTA